MQQGPIINVNLSLEDELAAMLARMMYVHHVEYRGKTPEAAPFAPEWAYAYARIAIAYLDYDNNTVDGLREDYK